MAEIKTSEDLHLDTHHGHDDHGHDDHDHHGDKYQSSFVTRYFFSLDHKTIAKQFLWLTWLG